MKVALFGGCVPRGICSFYSSDGKVECRKERLSLSAYLANKFNCEVIDHSMRRSGLHPSGNVPFPNEKVANPENSVQWKIRNANLSGITHVIV